jgi:hypothetical protein
MERFLRGVIDADPIALGATVVVLLVLAVVWAARRRRAPRP